MWLVYPRLYLGDYRSGEIALSGAEYPVEPAHDSAPFAGIVSLCPMPIFPGDEVTDPASDLTEWLRVPIVDGGNGESEFELAIGVAIPFMRRRMRVGNVLVHCAAGMSRSVSVIAAYLCARGLDVEEAYERVALAKARALGLGPLDAMDLIAPASEFRSCLGRLYADRSL
jgi:hypothetical protein